jgi:hypothetical protein
MRIGGNVVMTLEGMTEETAPEAPIWETFRAVFESAVALFPDAGDRASLAACGWVLSARHLLREELRAADAALSIGLDLVDEVRALPAPERHFLRVAMLHALAAVRARQRRASEAIYIRNAAAAYQRDHLGAGNVLQGFLLVYQSSQILDRPMQDPRNADDTLDFDDWASAPAGVELPIC